MEKEGAQKESSGNDNNVRRCGQIGEGEDDVLSMVDVLNEEARLKADADAVLGGSDAHNCTYPEGYLKRQALYACATCTPNGNAGVCLACSYACHEGHDLFELYTKRHFTCDCGNEKFGNKECKLYQDKKELNARNYYNQNFKGLYCACNRPYPDPDDSIEDQMIQCIMCEDWYHGRHLKASVPEDDDYQEMICPYCMSKYSFLWAYYVRKNVTKVEYVDTKEEINTVSDLERQKEDPTQSTSDSPSRPPISSHQGHSNDGSSPTSGKRGADQCDQGQEPPKKLAKVECENGKEAEDCLLRQLQKRVVEEPDEATFWPEGWRGKLCRCPLCMVMYKDREIEYLIDENDTVQVYESKGQDASNGSGEEENEAAALASMNRVQQIEMVRGFMDLKSELNEFLQGFARDGKVVTETDIRDFFQHMNQKRRRQVQMPQHSCR